MNPRTQHELWSGHTGEPIEVSIDKPTGTSVGLAMISHPHPLFGGTKDNKVVQTLARAFLQLGYTTVRYNFRGVGQSTGVHDNGNGEADDLAKLTLHAHSTLIPKELQHQPIAMAGFSFGAFVTSHAAQRLRNANLTIGKLALVGAATSRFTLAQVPENTLVIHGEVDDTVPLNNVLRWSAEQNLPVIVLPGVDHFFHGKLPQLKELVVRYYPS
jgi:alpha/beta superfamily hydrolase